MSTLSNNLKYKKRQKIPNQKLVLTFGVLFLYRYCNTIPLSGIDQVALKQTFLNFEKNSSLFQILSMYSGSSSSGLLSPFSLGIVPFINASILVDLLTTVFPTLEKLQTEEGETGRRKLLLYKKSLTLVFAIGQSLFLLFSLKAYIYNTSWLNFLLITVQLTAGSFVTIWFTTLIDNKGLGNGTSLIIGLNILLSLLSKSGNIPLRLTPNFFVELLFLALISKLICLSQTARSSVEVVSARQLAFLEEQQQKSLQGNSFTTDLQMRENALLIRFNQAGIFPIIIASNLLPLFSFLFNFVGNRNVSSFLTGFSYYTLIVLFNYLYTSIFWDPEKIAERLRKSSVSLQNVSPGKETVAHLERVVRSASISGGVALSGIILLFEIVKRVTNGGLLSQINISSLIIVIGVAYDTQYTIKSLYRIYRN